MVLDERKAMESPKLHEHVRYVSHLRQLKHLSPV